MLEKNWMELTKPNKMEVNVEENNGKRAQGQFRAISLGLVEKQKSQRKKK